MAVRQLAADDLIGRPVADLGIDRAGDPRLVQSALPFPDDTRSYRRAIEATSVMEGEALSENPMTEDWFIDAVERVADAGHEACLAIHAAVGVLQAGLEARDAGRPIVDMVDELIAAGGRETRMRAADAFREYERAIASMRSGVVRALVDDGGLSLTDAAKRLKISRQAAARLYDPGPNGPESARRTGPGSFT
jgi:hypothetical protein